MNLSCFIIRGADQCVSVYIAPPNVPIIAAVELNRAGQFAVLAKTGITNTGITSVTGDIGASPITSAALVGYSQVKDVSNSFAISPLVSGHVYAADYLSPTPGLLADAVLDMQAAYLDAAARLFPNFLNVKTGLLNGDILEPGLHKWVSAVTVSNTITFHGSPTDVWIMQVTGAVTTHSNAVMELTGGAQAKNIFWQVVGGITIGIGSHVEGVFLGATAITFLTGSSMNGAALVQTAVTMHSATIVKESVYGEVVRAPNNSPVELLRAGQFAVLAKTGITSTGVSHVTGDIGASPITSAALVGYSQVSDVSNTFAISPLVTGHVYAADYLAPTSDMLADAVLDMQAAYIDAAGRLFPDFLNIKTGLLNGDILEPGLHKWISAVTVTGTITFSGSSTDVWIMQVTGAFNTASNAVIELTGGAQAKNIFWQVSGGITLGIGPHVEGVFLGATAITFLTGSSMNGAALVQTAVVMHSANIVKESVSSAVVNLADNSHCSIENNFFAAIAGTGTVCSGNENISVAAVPSGCGCQPSNAAPCTYNPDLKSSEVSCFLCTSIDLASGVCPGCNSCLSAHDNCMNEATTEEQYSFCLSQIGDEDRANCHDMCLKW